MSLPQNPKLDFIMETMKSAYEEFGAFDKSSKTDKARFDLVTSTDFRIEEFIISEIQKKYPDDRILSEETNSQTVVEGCTWTIDPIDGTYNMANGIRLYGVQCAMYIGSELKISAIYLPHFHEMYCAVAGSGAYLNGERIFVNKTDLEHSIVSFGDFPHSRPDDAAIEMNIIKQLSSQIARIRMFGAASIDFAFVASGKTDGAVIFTRNKWDIAPGILLCREAGAMIMDLNGEYSDNSNVVIAVATNDLYQVIKKI